MHGDDETPKLANDVKEQVGKRRRLKSRLVPSCSQTTAAPEDEASRLQLRPDIGESVRPRGTRGSTRVAGEVRHQTSGRLNAGRAKLKTRAVSRDGVATRKQKSRQVFADMIRGANYLQACVDDNKARASLRGRIEGRLRLSQAIGAAPTVRRVGAGARAGRCRVAAVTSPLQAARQDRARAWLAAVATPARNGMLTRRRSIRVHAALSEIPFPARTSEVVHARDDTRAHGRGGTRKHWNVSVLEAIAAEDSDPIRRIQAKAHLAARYRKALRAQCAPLSPKLVPGGVEAFEEDSRGAGLHGSRGACRLGSPRAASSASSSSEGTTDLFGSP